MKKWLKTDLHIHTSEDLEDRKDGTFIPYSPKQLIDFMAKNNFDALAIAHHNKRYYPKRLVKYAKSKKVLLIPAIEKTVENKHILFLNVKDSLPKIKTIKDLHKVPKNVLIIAPHPFHLFSHSLLSKTTKYIKYFDAIEFHSMYFWFYNLYNKLAKGLSLQYNKPFLANSDAHCYEQLLHTHSLIYAEKSIPSVIDAIKRNKIRIESKPLPFFRFIKEFISTRK